MKTIMNYHKKLLLGALTFAVVLLTIAFVRLAWTNKTTIKAAAVQGMSEVTVSLQEDVVVKFYTDAKTNDGSKVSVQFNGKTEELTENINGVFSFAGVTPQHFNDQMTVTMYAPDGKTQIGDIKTFSVQSYLETLLTRSYAESGCASNAQYAAMKELAVNLLNYGAAAQTYLGHDVENLANKNLTPEQRALATEKSKLSPAAAEKSVNGDMWVGAGVRFDYKLGLYFVFEAESLDGVTARIDGIETTPQIYDEDKNQYVIRYNAFHATNMNTPVTASLTVGQEKQTFTYSIQAYVAAKGDEDTPLADLVNATYAYGYAAVAYFAEYECKEPSFENEMSFEIIGQGYDFSGTPYETIALPALNSNDYTTVTTKTGLGKALQVATTYFYKQNPRYRCALLSDDCIQINKGGRDVFYSRYDLASAKTENVTIAYEESTGYTYQVSTAETLTDIRTFGAPLTITGNVTLTTGADSWKHQHDLTLGTEDLPATVTLDSACSDYALSLSNGADMTVKKGSVLTVLGAAPVSLYCFTPQSSILIDGSVTTNGDVVLPDTNMENPDWEYGYIPALYVKNGTMDIQGQLKTNGIQVGSEIENASGTLKVSYNGNTIVCANSSSPLHYTFAKGSLILRSENETACAINVSNSSAVYLDIRKGMTVQTNSAFSSVIGQWTKGQYYISLEKGVRCEFFSPTQRFIKIGKATADCPVNIACWDTATIFLDGEEKAVRLAQITTYTDVGYMDYLTGLAESGQYAVVSYPAVAENATYISTSITVSHSNLGLFTQAVYTPTSGEERTLYYQVIS